MSPCPWHLSHRRLSPSLYLSVSSRVPLSISPPSHLLSICRSSTVPYLGPLPSFRPPFSFRLPTIVSLLSCPFISASLLLWVTQPLLTSQSLPQGPPHDLLGLSSPLSLLMAAALGRDSGCMCTLGPGSVLRRHGRDARSLLTWHRNREERAKKQLTLKQEEGEAGQPAKLLAGPGRALSPSGFVDPGWGAVYTVPAIWLEDSAEWDLSSLLSGGGGQKSRWVLSLGIQPPCQPQGHLSESLKQACKVL